MSESSQNNLPTNVENFRNFRVFGNGRKTSETLGEFSNVMRSLRKSFITFQSDICGLKIGFKNFDIIFILLSTFVLCWLFVTILPRRQSSRCESGISFARNMLPLAHFQDYSIPIK